MFPPLRILLLVISVEARFGEALCKIGVEGPFVQVLAFQAWAKLEVFVVTVICQCGSSCLGR